MNLTREVICQTVDPERWRKIERIYHLALERDPGERDGFLAEACPDDSDLLREVASLLAQNTETVVTPGSKLGPYQILALLGEGGMGKVYRGLDTRLGRPVAIKVSAEKFSKRFEHEARAISALNHPHICTLYDVGPNYMVTELVDGETLREWVQRTPPKERRLEVAKQVLEALRAAHRAGIVHRDLKPANIMVRSDGYAKVLDFGLAKRIAVRTDLPREEDTATDLSIPGQIMGTVAYMSPEQIQGQEIDARSDLFAFGIVLHEMLTGEHPWRRGSALETMHAILHDPAPALDATLGTGADVASIVRTLLAKNPAQRYASAEAVLEALASQPVSAAVAKGKAGASIAVLPFANMSAEKENEHFGDGLAEEIINVLAHVPSVKVAGRTSSFFFRGKDVEFAEIGRRLNVEHILEGSVRKAGNRIRVTAQLIKVTDGFHLWSERYDRELTDIFAIQDEITEAIAGALKVKLSVEDAAPRRHVPNLRAYEAYLKARQRWLNPTPESLARMKELLDHAIELDPEFALPYSLLGGYYSFIAGFGIRPPREAIPLARAAELEALRADPELPEAHALLACWNGSHDHDWNEAERRWRLAMAREPVSHDVRFWYGNHYLVSIGRVTEAVETMARALQEDPLNLLYRHILAHGLRNARRLEDAASELRKVLEIDENFPPAVGQLGAVYAQQGRFEEALALTERAGAAMPWDNAIQGQLAGLLVRSGQKSRADGLIEKLRPGGVDAALGMAVFHAIVEEFDQAAEWAERAIEERCPRLIGILGPLLRYTVTWPGLARLMNLPGY
jgi:TolB-like protein/tRNA A-37 threonylcarbamoyl transferase component Bud32/Tfp pilus assembly protein PilF